MIYKIDIIKNIEGWIIIKNLFLAKSNKGGVDSETIQEHTDKLLVEFDNFKKMYPNLKNVNWEILRIACIYHDLGKMNTKMQIKLGSSLKDTLNEIEEIPHGYLSPAFLPKKYLKSIFSTDELKILYQSIYYHHTRPELNNNDDLIRTIKEDLSKYIDYFEYDKLLPFEGLHSSFRRYVPLNNKESRICMNDGDIFYKYIMTKGLLNKIDYSASAGIPIEKKNDDLLEKTINSITSKGFDLNELQEYMLENQNENNIIVASTGIGKTEAALLWIGNNKGFFTLPLKVSINAIYDRIIDSSKIGFDKENTGLLHSDTYAEYLNRSDNFMIDESYMAQTKQLGLPLTVCTLDQLVDFIFKYPGFEIKLATLSYSKLIIDEIQMYSPEMIAYLLLALKYISDMGGNFSIVTATLPTIIIDFLKELGVDFKMPSKPFIKKDSNTNEYQVRHKIKMKESRLNVNDILSSGYDSKKILVIANTVKEAQRIYIELKNILGNDFNLNLLHSRFIKKDRKEKENAIFSMGQLNNKDTGIWVTTQIVEASLDIDFDVLYTELSEVSGLFQRMGRVYRNRNLLNGITNIYIYYGNNEEYPSGVKKDNFSIVDFDIFKLSKKTLLKYDNKVLDEFNKMNIVSEIYSKEKIKDTNYYNTIKSTIEYCKDIPDYDFDKSDVKLREIYTESFIPKCVYIDNQDYLEELHAMFKNSKSKSERQLIKNKIKEYTVSWDYYRTMKANCYHSIQLSKYEKIRILDFEYDSEVGIHDKKSEFNSDEQFL